MTELFYSYNVMKHHINTCAYYISILAIILGIFQMLPNMHILYVKKNKKNISFTTVCIGLIASMLWCLYGYMCTDFITILSSGISGILHIIVLTLYSVL